MIGRRSVFADIPGSANRLYDLRFSGPIRIIIIEEADTDNLLLESGDALLLETGDLILLEA
jgi:hypothetical protein